MVGRGSDEVTVKNESPDACVAIHLAGCLGNDVGECLNDFDCGAEAVCQLLIVIAVFLEGLFSFMQELDDRLGRI